MKTEKREIMNEDGAKYCHCAYFFYRYYDKVTDISKEPGAGGANILDLLLIADTNTPFSSLSLSTIHVLLLVSDDCGCGEL